jgi:hypothetical protein
MDFNHQRPPSPSPSSSASWLQQWYLLDGKTELGKINAYLFRVAW